MITAPKVQEIIFAHREELRSLGVEKLFLFGSVAKKKNQETSDVDLLVKFHFGKKNFDNFMDLSFHLEKILEEDVDLMTDDSLSEKFRNSIMSEALEIEI
ncbi:nucleotidyltransferase family protein [Leptospira andrefontaineae]|uniref:nucleotidyltransferase family protein n=1 Tax=Leptospira andrefontaineae TaxID=2484976 RepID=UPI001ABF4A65|nr:nucleotidyltransferase domain-containing protein [Leptospira andrefontaineae]